MPVSALEQVAKARQLHAAGALAEAERRYVEVLHEYPSDPEALHGLGVLRYQQGRRAEALELVQLAILAKPDFADALNSCGLILAASRRYEEALASFKRAVSLSPNDTEIARNVGSALGELGRHEEALAVFDRVLDATPADIRALNCRGVALRKLKRHKEALACFEKAVETRNDDPESLGNKARALATLNQHEQALSSFDAALAARPNDATLLYERGNALSALRRYEEAVSNYDQAIRVKHNYAEAFCKRANVLKALGRYDNAIQDYHRALAINPGYFEALKGLGHAFAVCRRVKEALATFEKIISIRADNAAAIFDKSLCDLTLGNLTEGWKDYEWRWKTKHFSSHKRDFEQPIWLGKESLSGKTILLHAEQGLGDTLQFVRYVPKVAQHGAHVLLEIQAPLRTLLDGLEGTERVFTRGEALPEFDTHCPLMSLPLAFGTALETVPAKVPYLSVPVRKIEQWQRTLGAKTKPQVGIFWAGNPSFKNDRNRSVPLSGLLGLLEIGVDVVSLQKDVRSTDEATLSKCDKIRHFGDEIKDFGDTAALVSLMDLIISVDTAAAHLAGALAKPVWILLPFAPDWRWLLDRDDSPWYPTARLYRQPRIGDWDSVVRRAVEDVRRRFQ